METLAEKVKNDDVGSLKTLPQDRTPGNVKSGNVLGNVENGDVLHHVVVGHGTGSYSTHFIGAYEENELSYQRRDVGKGTRSVGSRQEASLDQAGYRGQLAVPNKSSNEENDVINYLLAIELKKIGYNDVHVGGNAAAIQLTNYSAELKALVYNTRNIEFDFISCGGEVGKFYKPDPSGNDLEKLNAKGPYRIWFTANGGLEYYLALPIDETIENKNKEFRHQGLFGSFTSTRENRTKKRYVM